MKNTKLISINGKIYSPQEAKISVFDRGFLYGDAVYEVARSYGRVFFELEKHIQRLFKSAESIGMDLQKTPEDYIQEIYQVYSLVPDENMYMRIQITRGEGDIGLSTKLSTKPNVIIYIRHLEFPASDFYSKGQKVVTTDRLRNSKRALDPNIKSGNYLNNVLAYRKATDEGAFEAVMINTKGEITEGTTSNIFRVQGGVVYSPPDDADILRGITRGIVKSLCSELGISYKEEAFSGAELEKSEEVFLTSSTKEVVPVRQVNASSIKAPGEITQRLAMAYKEYVKKYCEERKHLGVVRV